MSQRILQYQAAVQLSSQAPEVFNKPLLYREMLEVLGVKNADKIIEVPDEVAVPMNPVSENMALLKQEPVKAFMEQDHDSHITVHMAMGQDPQIAQLMGQDPNANAIKAAVYAHIQEHLGFRFRQQLEQQLGTSLPPEGTQLPPDMEAQLAKLTAQAAQQLVQAHQTQAAQQQVQQQMQDPVMQMQQKELQLKEQEIQDKKFIEIEKLKTQKEVAMLNNEAKLLLQNEDAKVQGLFKGMDMATTQQNVEAAPPAPPPPAAPPVPPQPPMPPQGQPVPQPPPMQ
jgi:hypothetical protein